MRSETSSKRVDPQSEVSSVELSRLRAALWRQPRLTTSSARKRVRRPKPRRREWGLASCIRRYPYTGALIGLAVFAGCWIRLVGAAPNVDSREYEPPQDVRLAARAAIDVADILEVIGHGVSIRSIEAPRIDDRWSARYRIKEQRILVSSALHFSDDQMLTIMGHECAHALFFQLDLLDDWSEEYWWYQHVVHETAATVIGAHVAGAVRSRRGGDGAALIEKCLREEKAASQHYKDFLRIDRKRPSGAYLRHDGPWVTRAFRTGGFFGAEDLIDEMDQICREHPDPVVAARIIAERFHNVDAETARSLAPPADWNPQRKW